MAKDKTADKLQGQYERLAAKLAKVGLLLQHSFGTPT